MLFFWSRRVSLYFFCCCWYGGCQGTSFGWVQFQLVRGFNGLFWGVFWGATWIQREVSVWNNSTSAPPVSRAHLHTHLHIEHSWPGFFRVLGCFKAVKKRIPPPPHRNETQLGSIVTIVIHLFKAFTLLERCGYRPTWRMQMSPRLICKWIHWSELIPVRLNANR